MSSPGTALVASWYVCLIPTVPLVILRLRFRWRSHEKLSIDDLVFIAAIVVMLAFNVTIVFMWIKGLADWNAGYDVSEARIVEIMRMFLPSKLLYISAAWAIKFSVVLFYRIVAPLASRVVLVCYIVMGYLAVSLAVLISYTLFGCLWLDEYWAGNLDECPTEFTLISWALLTGLSISTNILVVCLPITMLRKLDMRFRENFAIGFMFFLGSIVIAANSAQAYYNKQDKKMLSLTASMAELSVGLMATSFLALSKPLLGNDAFKASALPRRSHRLTLCQRKICPTEKKLLEAFKIEDTITLPQRSSSIIRPSSTSVAASVHSRTRMSIASKDSLVLPGQYHIGFTMEEAKEEEGGARSGNGFEKITVCVEVGEMESRSELEVKSPGMESWFER